MGVAGTGILDSDSVADFVYEIEESGDVSLLRSFLSRASDPDLRKWEDGILAAVYLVALTRTAYASASESKIVSDRLAGKGLVIPSELVGAAHRAITRVIQNSPAANWLKESDYQEWKANLQEMETCLEIELKRK
jgi:hypothetical protein